MPAPVSVTAERDVAARRPVGGDALAAVVAGLDGDAPARRHRLGGVAQQDLQDQLGLDRIDAGDPQVVGEVEVEGDRRAEQPGGPLAAIAQQRVEVDRPGLGPVPAREGQEMAVSAEARSAASDERLSARCTKASGCSPRRRRRPST